MLPKIKYSILLVLLLLIAPAKGFSQKNGSVCDSLMNAIAAKPEPEKMLELMVRQTRECFPSNGTERLLSATKCYTYAKKHRLNVPFALYSILIRESIDANKIDDGIAYASELIEAFDREADTLNGLYYRNFLAKTFVNAGDVEQGTELLNKILPTARTYGDTNLICDILLSQVWTNMKLGQNQEAYRLVTEIETLNQQSPIPEALFAVVLHYHASLLGLPGMNDSVHVLQQAAIKNLQWQKIPVQHIEWYFNIARGAMASLIEEEKYDEASSLLNDMNDAAYSLGLDKQKSFIWLARAVIASYSPNQWNIPECFDSAEYYGAKEKLWFDLRWLYKVKGEYASLSGDYKTAYHSALLFAQYSDSVNKEINNDLWTKNREEHLAQKQQQELEMQQLKFRNTRFIMYILAILLLMLLVFSYMWMKQRRMRTRARLAEKEKEIAQLSQRALLQQMNPHFIFNTLNSIQYFMYRNHREATIEYLGNFSKLIRKVLENSRHEIIPLQSEIEALEYYLKLEQIRFDGKFTYTIEMTEQVDALLFKIPAMLIQPFAENAILHGFMHKEDSGFLHISIDLSNNDQNLLISIDDNGIGRAKAAEIKELNPKENPSLGTKITGSRIDILNQWYNGAVKLQITDKMENGTPSGTRVQIELPVFYE